MHDDARFGGVIGSHDVVVARVTMGNPLTAAPAMRRDHFMFAHDGTVADVARIRRRVSPRRAFQIESDAHADSLFAYLLSHVDSAESADVALLRATADIASSGLRGNFSFILSTEEAMYVHCGARSLGFVERSRAVIASSQPLTKEPRRLLAAGSLLRVNRGAKVTWRVLVGSVESPSDPELPFTD